MKKLVITLFSLFLLCSMANAAGSVKFSDHKVGMTRFITIAWTADASGDVSAAGSYILRGGTVIGFQADPESGVTDAYDLTIQAEWSIPTQSSTRTIEFADILSGAGADLSNSENGEFESLSPHFFAPSCKITPTIAAAGNATSGTIVLVIWEE